ncbi:hypothetical protein [Streptomyces longispororuber]|uniref:hypothetical protein n=1 Tax=Streptomyces longispororuber TaxID=68230 RepID=UPI002109A039|nr:hypothetical protein [Streptomyces longispororuber]MCQ4212931.1 hypothetical protein [Streptomyces longispororuber]
MALGTGPTSGSPAPTGWRRGRSWMRRHRLLSGAVATVVVAAGVVVPLTVTGASATPCRTVSATVRALADDPAAATAALDPADDASRLSAARNLLDHDRFCGDGARVLGRVITAGTGATSPAAPHTEAQARATYAVAAALSHRDGLPEGLSPAVARMLAEYVVDVTRQFDSIGVRDDLTGPAEPAATATALDPSGYTPYGRFLAPHEAHVNFGYAAEFARAQKPELDLLVAELTADPQAFAILYDAELAYVSHYVERLTDRAGDPDARVTAENAGDGGEAGDGGDGGGKERSRARGGDWHSDDLTWPDNDLEDAASLIGSLMQARSRYAKDGTIGDLAAFDRSVRARLRGVYRTADDRVTSRPPMGTIAGRPVSGRLRGDVFDGRRQLTTVYDAWARARGIPAERAAGQRQLMDDAYVRGYWLRTVY